MAVVTTAPVRDLSAGAAGTGAPADGHSLDCPFDEIVQGTGRAAELGLGTGVSPAVTLLPRLRLPGPRNAAGLQATAGFWLYQLGNVISTLAFALFLFLAIGPHLFPYQTMTMLTGSMTPTIRVGDVAVDTRTRVGDLRPGDIITYHIPVDDHRVVSHRIVSLTPEPDGSTTVQTKGDANPTNDPWQANFTGGTVWKVRTVVPKIGLGIHFLRQPGVQNVARYGAPALLVVLAFSAIWKRPSRKRSEPDPHDVQHLQSPFAQSAPAPDAPDE